MGQSLAQPALISMPEASTDKNPERKPLGAQILLASVADRLPTHDGAALAIIKVWEHEGTIVQEIA